MTGGCSGDPPLSQKREAGAMVATVRHTKEIEMTNDPLINWDCEFFTGENERLLLNSTLNTIEIENLPSFIKMLNEYLQNTSAWDKSITAIEMDGCDDAIVRMADGATHDIDGETTFSDILAIISED